MERSAMALVESPGPFCAAGSLQRSKRLSGRFGGVISPNVPGLWLGQPSPAAGPLPQVATATALFDSGVSAEDLPTAAIPAPFVACQPFPFPAGERPWPDPRSAPEKGVNGTQSEYGCGESSIPTYPTHPFAVPIPAFRPSTSLSLYRFKLPPLLSKNVPLPHPQLHPLGWQQNPPVAITTSSSPAKSARPCHTSLPASKSPSLCEQHSFPPQVFAICLQGGDCSVRGGCRPCATPMCLLPPPCMLCSPPVWSTHKTWTTFTVPHTLWAKTPLLWPVKPMQIKLWIHEKGRITWNMVKKMYLGLYPGLVWKLEGMSSKKVKEKKKL